MPGLSIFPHIPWRGPTGDGPRVLLLNPWIYDFAAFNLWSRPVGLLACAFMLTRSGCATAVLDCLDRTWADMPWPRPRPDGRGHYPKTPLPKPAALAHVPRRYGRYGLPFEAVEAALRALDPAPDMVFVGSGMTYWAPGPQTALALCRKIWPKTPLVLGGVYASLLPEHARRSCAADLVVAGPLERPDNWEAVWRLAGAPAPAIPQGAGLSLAEDLYPGAAFAPILGSRGCPYGCAYCASKRLFPGFSPAPPQALLASVMRRYAAGTRHFAFYDDALLVDFDDRLGPLLEGMLSAGLDLALHTPNAVHAALLGPKACRLLKACGLSHVRIGLESLNFSGRLDRKLQREDWEEAVDNLLAAGFAPEEIGLNLLFMLPGQDLERLAEDVRALRRRGFRVHLSDYSPIPGTTLFAEAVRASRLPLESEPLVQNNSIWPCHPQGFSWDELKRWREILSERVVGIVKWRRTTRRQRGEAD